MTIIHLVDINLDIVKAWQTKFADEPSVQAEQGDITNRNVDVWVTPTNSTGRMTGGVDYAVKNKLGALVEFRIQEAIDNLYEGVLPIGRAVIVDSPSGEHPKYVVATPSMIGESDNITRTRNTALACAAAFQAIYYAEDKHGATINSIAIPGLGSGTGKVPPSLCADLMYIGYTLFRRKRYESFAEMLEHLHAELGLIGQDVKEDPNWPQQELVEHTPKEACIEGPPAPEQVELFPSSDYVMKTPIGTPII